MALLPADTDRHVETLTDQEADQEVDIVEASVAISLLLDGTAEAVAVATVLVQVDLHLVTAQTHITCLKEAWRLLSDSGHLKTNSLQEAPRPAVTLLLARLSKWTSARAAHPMRCPTKFRLTV